MTRPRAPRLAARLGWLALVGLAAGLIATAAPVRYRQLATVSTKAASLAGQLRPQDLAVLEQARFPIGWYAGYITAAETAAALVYVALAAVVSWLRPGDRAAALVSFVCVSMPLSLPLLGALESVSPTWALPLLAARAVWVTSMVWLLFTFPDGRFVPGWTLWPALGLLAYALTWLVNPAWAPRFSYGAGLVWRDIPLIAVMLGMFGFGLAAQVYRYRNVSGAVQRQQTKWVVLGFSVFGLLSAAGVTGLVYSSLTRPDSLDLGVRLGGPTLLLVGLAAIPATISLSILRYRLWDIDLLIRRTLVYTLLTAVLAGVYFGSVAVLQILYTALGGQPSAVGIVASTLAIAALFSPLRRRVQNLIDRRFYRRKVDAAKTLTEFGRAARDETDLERLSARLVDVVRDTFEPAHVTFWQPTAPDQQRR
jgi:hypothetical protein